MTPQIIHDLWLIVTATSTLNIGGIAIYLIVSFRHSRQRWFFLWLGFLLITVTIEQVCAQVKNYFHPAPPDDPLTGLIWLAGRTLEMVVGGIVLGYLVFARSKNGNPT